MSNHLSLHAPHNRGFTIVELLIVIVVIAILAAISIVGFNGVSARAKEAAARAELSNLAKNFQLFKIESSQYPSFDNGLPALELEAALRQTNLWTSTRATIDPIDNTQFKVAKSFLFCASPALDRVVIVAMHPVSTGFVSTNLGDSVGKKLIYYSLQEERMQETTFKYDVVGQNTAVNVCKSVMPDYDYRWWPRRWSFDTPTLKAQ